MQQHWTTPRIAAALSAAIFWMGTGCDQSSGVETDRAAVVRPVNAQADEAPALPESIRFNRDIRPILSDRCYACHGPDSAAAEDSGGFRLDSFEHATAPAPGGAVPIVPGDAEASEIIKRITTDNPRIQMPPPSAKITVTDREAAMLKRWIDEGAVYEGHWAYETPIRPALPEVADRDWPRNEIDLFIAARLEQAGLSPSAEADRATLIRRVSLDLVGLPPTLEEIDAFVSDDRPDAYKQLVDRLLASPHFGERMALPWLDAARYADTIGYQLDHYRNSWPYRNYVIESFNENKPYDQFLIEQLAGDLLPNATQEQKLATAFCRLHMMNHEAGSIDEEYRVANVSDRIETLTTVFMAQTYNCAKCHDHKYDPTTQQDYYNLFMYFSSIPEKGVYTNKPEQAIAYAPRMNWLPAGVTDPKQAVPISVMQELDKPRQEYLLERGEYDKPIEDRPAKRELPSFIDLPMPEGSPNNRLGFAQWLARPDHPLTARVQVNRLWQMLFGAGIVKTVEDFGSQADWPSHLKLLDYLAVDFVESGWDQKQLIKKIVMSATYRQRAARNPAATGMDPENRLLSSFPRQRMSGEMIRDHALAVSGLLNKTLGGPSVKPYQPDGLWREVSMGPRSNTHIFKRDDGEDLYRRSLYTFIKRKSPPPQLSTFGAPNREACVVQRELTNTPLQVLVLWNDKQFLEAARVLAQRILSEQAEASDDVRLSSIFRRSTGQRANDKQLAVLRDVLAYYRERYDEAEKDAKALLDQGEHALPEQYDACELAAWMMVSSTVLSLDETIVRD